MSQPLIIDQFELGMAESPHKGFGLMKCVNLYDFPGATKVQKAPATLFTTSTSSTFTADDSTDICTGATFINNANTTAVAVRLTTTGTLPAGLATSTVYFVIKVNQVAGTFKLATTITNANAGTAINITDTGSGTHTVHTVNPGTINHIVKEPRTDEYFLLDSNGRVWFTAGTGACNLMVNSALDTGTGTLTNAAGNGLVFYKQNDGSSTHYLIVFRNALVDIANAYGSAQWNAPSWTNSWKSLNSGAGSGNSHHALVGQDDIVYFCDGRYVGSLKENIGSTFDPATSSTYTYNSQALDLPTIEIAQYLEELGTNLQIASNKTNKIYPWDRISDSFSQPLMVPEAVIKKIKNIGNVIYILAGTRGNIYYTQGSYVRHLLKLPEQVINNAGTIQSNVVTWGGIEAMNGNLLVGAGVLTTGNSGVYLIDLQTGAMTIDRIPSTGSANATAIYGTDDFYIFGYANGADYTSTSLYSNFEGVIQSAFYKVATKTEKATFSTVEVVLAKPASTGNVRVSYRTNTSGSFTTLDTFAADGSNTTFENDAIGLIDIENIQVQAELDGAVELAEIRLLP